jgi:tetratricopeptide (TPR) repeat protein
LKKIHILLLLVCTFFAKAQSKNPTFLEAMKKLQATEYEAGIKLLDQVILQTPNDYPALFNRAVAKSMLKNFDAAILDIDAALKAKADAKKAYVHRAIILKKLSRYEAAMADIDKAIQLDANYSDAYMNKGLLFEYLSKYEEACTAFKKAKELGLATAYPKVDFCETPINERQKSVSILKLETLSKDKSYGFSPKNPIKVGAGTNGATENEQTYLDLLRDEKGQHIKYVYKEKGPSFSSANAPGGNAFLTKYEIKYVLKDGAIKTNYLFFNHFEFIEPQILLGFGTVK